MKKLIAVIGIALCAVVTSQAQSTNGITAPPLTISSAIGSIGSDLVNGGTAAGFYGQKMSDPKTHAWGGIYGYNLTQNTNGVNGYIVVGVDHLWSTQPGAAPANFTLSGGITLDSGDYNIGGMFGVTNSWLNHVTVKGFTTILVGSETGGGAQVMNVERVGGYIDIHDWTVGQYVVEPDIGIAYGNRTGVNSTYNGNWIDVFAAVSIHGKKP